MNHYKLRITTQDLDMVKAALEEHNEYCYVQEVSSKDVPHVHAYIITEIKEATFRLHLRNSFGKGNEMWSLSKLQLQEGEVVALQYLGYMTKDAEVQYPMGIGPGCVLNWFDPFAKEHNLLVKRRITADKSTRLQRLERYLVDADIEIKDDPNFLIAIIDWHLQEGYQFDDSSLIKMYRYLLCKTSSDYKCFYMHKVWGEKLR